MKCYSVYVKYLHCRKVWCCFEKVLRDSVDPIAPKRFLDSNYINDNDLIVSKPPKIKSMTLSTMKIYSRYIYKTSILKILLTLITFKKHNISGAAPS